LAPFQTAGGSNLDIISEFRVEILQLCQVQKWFFEKNVSRGTRAQRDMGTEARDGLSTRTTVNLCCAPAEKLRFDGELVG
jgi:hypothetical protein